MTSTIINDEIKSYEFLKKLLFKKQARPGQEHLNILYEIIEHIRMQDQPTRIAISTCEGIHYRPLNDIIRLEAHQNYTAFVLKDHEITGSNSISKILASNNLKKYEGLLESYPEFMRVHRSHLVNLRSVEKYVRSDGGYLVMSDKASVCISGVCKDELLERLERL